MAPQSTQGLIQYSTLSAYVQARLITAHSHPEDPHVIIYNYTPQCSFKRAWDGVTTRCRGLVIDWRHGRILTNTIPKFFDLPNGVSGPCTVTEKMDGWLGIIFHWDGRWRITTRGRFTTSITPCAEKMLAKVDRSRLDPQYTYLVEIIHPITSVVVKYGFEGLVFLAARHTATGNELHHRPDGFLPLPQADTDNLAELRQRDLPNREGYVAHFADGRRFKIKFPWYRRMLEAKKHG